MENFFVALLIPILIGTLIIIIILMATGEKKSSTSKVVTNPNGTPAAGNVNPPHSGHATPTKSKTNWFSNILWTIFILVLIVAVLVFLAWALPYIKKAAIEFFEPSPQYKMVLVYDRTVPVNLDSDWNDANTVYFEEGEKCTFKEATVSFCVKNLGNLIVCGEPNTDPNLPNRYGDLNLKLWFKSEYGPSGTIKVDVFKRKRKRVN